ncbi:hypothetical protein IAG25_27445 [Caballeronia sp. EK]|jgi:hypothetical protein|uniref:hypothetical protein n=1 Tax=Caballeronia sp. EK TaxID=2767469 RepID=UPI00165599FC|nr:hypothetical protein [Caballeronia sp. EK]MBC8640576.1 hypothetical protein [Caballeronia sp. EK]
MSEPGKSLRFLMHDWLGRAGNIRVSRAARSKAMPWRAVRIEVTVSSTAFAIVFFRHDDGSWRVYPPTSPSLSINLVPT